MKIEHIAIWTKDIEVIREFYLEVFGLTSNEKYYNTKKGFTSYFLSFESGARLELMHRQDISEILQDSGATLGLTHFAVSLGSKEKVEKFTELVRSKGYKIKGEPRTTGDGYYESVIEDPEGNTVELTV